MVELISYLKINKLEEELNSYMKKNELLIKQMEKNKSKKIYLYYGIGGISLLFIIFLILCLTK